MKNYPKQMLQFDSTKRNIYPITNNRDLLVGRLEIRNFLGDPNFITLNIYDVQNVNQPIAQYKANHDFFTHENKVMQTSFNTKGKRFSIPSSAKNIIFEIAESGVPLGHKVQFKVIFDLSQ